MVALAQYDGDRLVEMKKKIILENFVSTVDETCAEILITGGCTIQVQRPIGHRKMAHRPLLQLRCTKSSLYRRFLCAITAILPIKNVSLQVLFPARAVPFPTSLNFSAEVNLPFPGSSGGIVIPIPLFMKLPRHKRNMSSVERNAAIIKSCTPSPLSSQRSRISF